MSIQERSKLTCPMCSFQQELIMPLDACIWFYECPGCEQIIKPKPGDCCVFCSYGSVPCPPRQIDAEQGGCCG